MLRSRSFSMATVPLFVALACVAGCGADDTDSPDSCEPWQLTTKLTTLELDCEGRVGVQTTDGRHILVAGIGAALLDATDASGLRLSTDAQRDRMVERIEETDALGDATRLVMTVRGQSAEPDLIWIVSAYPATGEYTFRIAVDNRTDAPVKVAKTIALETNGEWGGGLFLGEAPARHRILENGAFAALDFTVEVLPGDAPPNVAYAALAPGDYPGHSVSNWNHSVVDLDSSATWIAGALTFESSLPVFNLSFDPEVSITLPDGRQGFSYFSAQAAYQPLPKPVAPGDAFSSELYYLHPSEPDALLGLERYADNVAATLEITPWQRRGSGRRVPSGWNSWSGSVSTGGYGTGIDEQIVLDNLEVMATQLRDWGFDWFQIDDGFEPRYGDWTFNPERFPHGPAWLTAQIRAKGMKPGLWMAPFTPDPQSDLAKAHPDWLAAKVPIGELVASDSEILDLTNPEVLAYLSELFDRFRNEWGFDWLKLDFGYYALFGTGLHDPTVTREEAWREALRTIRRALGDDTFFMLVGTLGFNYGIVDSGRTTLDTMPIWDWEPGTGAGNHLQQQGFKPTVRTAGRRWYLQDRVWINHPDLIFFRRNTLDDSWPPVTLDESRALSTFVGLSGGIVKIGDRLVDLAPEHINVLRQLMPNYGVAARPRDLFTREFPEVWQLDVDRPLDGYADGFSIIGLFNWGRNFDMSVEPYGNMADDGQPRHHVVDLTAIGLDQQYLAYEFWTEQYLGVVDGQLALEVPSHTARVVALRDKRDVPQFLGWNRQITMGGTLLQAADWDDESRVLTLTSQVAAPTPEAPFVYSIAFHVPSGFVRSGIETRGVPVDDLQVSTEGEVLRIRFVPRATGSLTLTLSF